MTMNEVPQTETGTNEILAKLSPEHRAFLNSTKARNAVFAGLKMELEDESNTDKTDVDKTEDESGKEKEADKAADTTKSFTQEDVNRIAADRAAREKANADALKVEKDKLQADYDALKVSHDETASKFDTLNAEVATEKAIAMKYRIAFEENVTPSVFDKVSGSTEDEFRANLKFLKESLASVAESGITHVEKEYTTGSQLPSEKWNKQLDEKLNNK